jgi:hypothetical protein
MRIIRSAMFTESLRALQRSDGGLFEVVAADLRYLLARRRTAQLPQVRFGIRESAFSEALGEVRSHIEGDKRFIRTLFAMPSSESCCAFLVMGDKNSAATEARSGNDWYDAAIPLADALWREILSTL